MVVYMKIIALFLPAVLTVAVYHKRNNGCTWDWFKYITEYALAILVNTFITQSVITYLFGFDGVDSTAFESFPFFTKYIAIAFALAVLFPYIRELVSKAFSVSFEIGVRDEKKK